MAKIDTRDGAARALALVTVKSDDDGGSARFFLQARGDDADDTRMPAFAGGPDERCVQPTRFGLLQCRFAHGGFDVLSFAVQRVELFSQGQRFVAVDGGKTTRPEVRAPDAAARIDARSKDEAEVIGGGRRIDPRHICQRSQPGAGALSHDDKALAHQGAVDPDQRGDISDRRQGDEIKHVEKIRTLGAFLFEPAVGFNEDQKDDGCGAKVGKVSGLVLPVGVHDSDSVGKRFAPEMVVEDHHVRTPGSRNRVVAERSAIDADDQVVIARQRRHGGRVRAIALVDAVRDIKGGASPHLAQPVNEKRGRAAAVDIVVGEDGNALVARDR